MPFSHSEPCPRCREHGNDRKGDNLARYSNGSAYCFSCRLYEPPTIYRGEFKKASKRVPDLTEEIPMKNMTWLTQYISNEEVRKYFRYSQALEAHVFTHIHPDGSIFWEARGVDPKRVDSGGIKPILFIGEGSHLVIVEDIVSAIKVGRQFVAMPLFGANMRNDWIAQIGRNKTIRSISYWLDEDKKKEAVEYVRKTSLFAKKCFAVFSEKDPKEYSNEEIKELVLVP